MVEAVIVFAFNFPNYHEVIRWIADHQHRCSYEHLLQKWEHFADVYSPVEAWLYFYMDCDADIRESMTDYIVEVFAPKSGNFNEDELETMDKASF